MSVKTYAPSQILIAVAGIPIDGFAPGTFITIERVEDTFSDTAGADGEVCRTQNHDKRGTITITLLQSSASNARLSALHRLDELTREGVGPFLARDLQGLSTYASENCWIRRHANAEFAKESTEREWVIACDKLEMLDAGY